MIETFHDAYQPRAGNRFEALPVQGVTYRVQAEVPIEKVAYPPIDRRNGGAPDVGREITLRRIYGEEVTAREYDRAEPPVAAMSSRAPRSSARSCPPPRSAPASVATVGRYGEIVIERA